uniref:(California timema) hypothetical protein n=1 Tax=Timema californicum TaxID=61474 RepID=A0A7R9IZW4_TIMCA|nr:unnamed protein product [Timema californicum]
MGNFPGRRKKYFDPSKVSQSPEKKPTPTVDFDNGLPSVVGENNDPEVIALKMIRNSLRGDLDTFILNNLLLSVQFFENFDRTIAAVSSSSLSDPDIQRNLAPHDRQCVLPDKLYEAVGQRVRFKPRHGLNKHYAETLAALRLHVVQDNVEMCDSLDETHYSSVDGPNYFFATESTSKYGYVKLRCDASTISNKRRNTYEEIEDAEEPNTIYSEPSNVENYVESFSNDIIMPEQSTQPGIAMMQELQEHIANNGNRSMFLESPSISAPNGGIITPKKKMFGPSSPERAFGLMMTETERKLSGTLQSSPLAVKPGWRGHNIKLPISRSIQRPDSESNNEQKRRSGSSGYKSGSLPNSRGSESSDYGYTTITALRTQKKLKECQLGRIPANSSEIPNECFDKVMVKVLDSNNSRKELFETRYYLNSDTFMCHFVDLFSDRLAHLLGFDDECVELATKSGAKIYCNKFNKIGHFTVKDCYEVIPTIKCLSWPKDANEWIRRSRKSKVSQQEMIKFKWPTKRMVEKVQTMGCHVLPVGYIPARGDNRNRLIEWQLSFPEVEWFLETCLSHSQIRCYLFVMALYKSFLESFDPELGLLPSHIRTLLFWQCEKHYNDWPEERLGETLKMFVNIIYSALQKKHIENYFIRSQNLLESVPSPSILKVQEKIFRIRENLVMHMLISVRNLTYLNDEGNEIDNFYPVLDYQRLYDILTTKELLTLANPLLARTGISTTNQADSGPKLISLDPEKEDEVMNLWIGVKVSNPQQQFAEKVSRQIEAESVANKITAKMANSKSTESINVKIHINKGADPLRRKLLLEMFIPHFIEMAKKSNQFRAAKQAQMYLQHASRLATLLGEDAGEEIASKKYLKTIKHLQEASKGSVFMPTSSGFRNPTHNFLPPQRDSRKNTPISVRTPFPLPQNTVVHPEIKKPPMIITEAHVHNQNHSSENGPQNRYKINVPNPKVKLEDDYEEIVVDEEIIEELTNEELQELAQNPSPESDSEEDKPSRTFTTKRIVTTFHRIQEGLQILADEDPDVERSARVHGGPYMLPGNLQRNETCR